MFFSSAYDITLFFQPIKCKMYSFWCDVRKVSHVTESIPDVQYVAAIFIWTW